MPVDSAQGKFGLRATALVALTVALLWGSAPAPAYNQIDNLAGLVSWQATSPGTIWDDTTKTISWEFYTGNLPSGGLPTAAEAGGAVQNSGQSVTEITGKSFNIVRLPDTTTPAVSRGPNTRITIGFAIGPTDSHGNAVLAKANAWTYVDDDNGVMKDADMFLNGNKNWSIDGSGGLDVQATSTHEFMHLVGAGHTPYFNARVFPFARSPINLTQDHAYSSDDRNFFRFVYGTGANGTLSGAVQNSGGGPAKRAVVVATDANGIPQTVMATDDNGNYSGLSVPPGSYTLTVWNGWTSAYGPTGLNDVDFDPLSGASEFINGSSVTPVTVTAGVNTPVAVITATDGSPRVWLTDQSLDPTNPQFQSIFVSNDPADPSNSGTMVFRLEPFNGMTALALTDIDTATLSLGPGITVTAAGITAQAGGGATEVHVPYTVTAGATPGARNLVINYTSGGERLFIPGVIKVVGQGGLTLAATAGNPTPQSSTLGAINVPLLGFSLTANGTNPEDVRIRRLAFNIAGAGADLPSVKLWVDLGTLGTIVNGVDTRIFTSAAYSTAFVEDIPGPSPGTVVFENLAFPIPIGTTVNFLLTADTPAVGMGSYQASLDPAGTTGGNPNLEAHGMYWGEALTATGATVTGGTLSTNQLTLSNLQQFRNPSNTAINPGESTSPDINVFLRGAVVSTVAGTVGMEVEVKPVTAPPTPFDGLGTVSVSGLVSPATVNVPVTGLTNPQRYHWRARATHSNVIVPPGPWTSFGTTSDSEVDFSCDSSTTTAPGSLAQTDAKGTTIVPGALTVPVKGKVILSGVNGTNAAGNVRLEVEVRLNSDAFTGVPNAFSAFFPSGLLTPVDAIFSSGPSGLYHWQARTANAYGTASSWVNFSATTPHFNFKRAGGSGGGGGCGATVAGDGGGFWWGALALGLLLIFSRRRGV